ncbi:hypothetical protein IRJ41_004607 [Triplophysa rosa]|uniref:Uncharacterized protein n=2 Tax=Triplophysa rosa TaxID=992332 RepID=A0A9W7TAP1_TRIRA|nr:hypothetical protein IRJ41_004607 [Triplophysa rosa]
MFWENLASKPPEGKPRETARCERRAVSALRAKYSRRVAPYSLAEFRDKVAKWDSTNVMNTGPTLFQNAVPLNMESEPMDISPQSSASAVPQQSHTCTTVIRDKHRRHFAPAHLKRKVPECDSTNVMNTGPTLFQNAVPLNMESEPMDISPQSSASAVPQKSHRETRKKKRLRENAANKSHTADGSASQCSSQVQRTPAQDHRRDCDVRARERRDGSSVRADRSE